MKKPPGGVDCSSFTNLKAAVRASWPKDWDAPGSAIDHVRVTYKDGAAGDDITVDRDEELQAAIQEGIKIFCVALPGASGEATPLPAIFFPLCRLLVGGYLRGHPPHPGYFGAGMTVRVFRVVWAV